MRPAKKIEYESLNVDYSYGSLAEDIWSNVEQEEVVVPKKETRKKKFNWGFFKRAEKPLVKEESKVHPKAGANYMSNLFINGFLIIFGIGALTYFSMVHINNKVVFAREQLLVMQRTERQLTNEINEMQIAVEQLKSPERIREIASTQLNMIESTDNVFVNASKSRTISQMYRAQVKDDVFVAMGK